MSCLFLSISDREELYALTFPNTQQYCDRYDHRFHKIFKSLDETRHISWSKIPFIIQQMQLYPDYEFYIWIDDDIYITNYSTNIVDIIKLYRFDNILVSKDPVDKWIMNCGLLVINNTKESINLLHKIYDLVDECGTRLERNWEQDAFIRYYQKYMQPDSKEIVTVPYRILQSFYRDNSLSENDFWKPGDFSAHFTGMEEAKRIEYIKKYKKETEKYQAKKCIFRPFR